MSGSMRTFHLVCEESSARQIEGLAREYGLTEQQVLEQLIDLGLDERSDEVTLRP